MDIFRQQLISPTYFTRSFLYIRNTNLFEPLLFNFFPDCDVLSKNLTFCFFASSKNQMSFSSFLQNGNWNLFNYFRYFLKISPSLSEHRSGFSRGAPQK